MQDEHETGELAGESPTKYYAGMGFDPRSIPAGINIPRTKQSDAGQVLSLKTARCSAGPAAGPRHLSRRGGSR